MMRFSILLFVLFIISCSSENQKTPFLETEIVSKDSSFYLKVKFQNNTNKKYYLANWNLFNKVNYFNSKDSNITGIIYEKEIEFIGKHFEMYPELIRNTISEVVSVNRTKSKFVEKAISLEVANFIHDTLNDEKYIEDLKFGYETKYSDCILINERQTFEDSIHFNAAIRFKGCLKIVFSYNPVNENQKIFSDYFERNYSINFNKIPLDNICGYSFYDKEFTDTIILRDGKIEVKYGN